MQLKVNVPVPSIIYTLLDNRVCLLYCNGMDYTPYQTEIIKRYYNNRDGIMTQKLSELTTDLYLAEGKKRERIWQRIVAALTQLGVEPARIEQLVNMDNPTKLAEFLKQYS